jgi:hypothetical protein
MNINRLSVAAGSALAMVALVVACSSSSSSGTGSSSGTSGTSGASGTSSSSGTSGTSSSSGTSGTSSSSGSSGGTQCTIAPGTYTIHYTGAATNGPTCTALPDQTITVSPSDGGAASDAGTPAGCTIANDTATCTTTVDCTTDTNGFSTVTHSKTTLTGTSVTGSSSNKTTQDADGGVLSDCGYDFTWTKQ